MRVWACLSIGVVPICNEYVSCVEEFKNVYMYTQRIIAVIKEVDVSCEKCAFIFGGYLNKAINKSPSNLGLFRGISELLGHYIGMLF